MGLIKTFRDPDTSLLQSAVDAVVERSRAASRAATRSADASPVPRPDLSDPLIAEATRAAEAVRAEPSQPPGPNVEEVATRGLLSGMAGFFSEVKTAVAHAAEEVWNGELDLDGYRRRLTAQFGQYDPRWAECALQYANYYVLRRGQVPYRRHQRLDEFDVTDRLPANARVAFVSDWGTGLEEAFTVLRQVAAKRPHVVFHLGDIYYSGTEEEVRRTFWQPVQAILRPQETGCVVFALSGNHDLYSGGHGYYALLDQLGQPASYFCLRNEHWQFLSLDTGLNGRFLPDRPTYLEDSELEWLTAHVDGAGERRNVLLSHHQLFAAYEDIDGGAFNTRLVGQVGPLLPRVPLWFWGHEHNFVVYEPYQGCRARCIGHGAIPVSHAPLAVRFGDVPVAEVALGGTGGFYNHGYAIMELDGPRAHVSYYQDSDENQALYEEDV